MMRWVVIIAAVLFGACSMPVHEARYQILIHEDPRHFVVVTLRNGGAAAPARAGSSPRDYGTAFQYGVSAAARAAVQQIAVDHRLQPVSQWPIAHLGVHCIVYRVSDVESQVAVLQRLRADPRVESAQPLNAFGTLAATYNDPYVGLQRNLSAMGIPAAHAWSRGRGVTVAVIDTAADISHADLAHGDIKVRDYTGTRARAAAHGTAVTGVIAATSNNLLGIVGVAPEAKVVSLAACWAVDDDPVRATCNSFTLAKALAAAIDLRANVVNLSLGGPSDPLLRRLVEHGLSKGMIFVGALPDGEPIGFPCEIPGVLAVDVAGRTNRRAALYAPGTDVLTLLPHDRYDFLSGSSLAAANVSGSIALLLAKHQHWDAGQVHAALARTSEKGASINVCSALAGEPADCHAATPSDMAAVAK